MRYKLKFLKVEVFIVLLTLLTVATLVIPSLLVSNDKLIAERNLSLYRELLVKSSISNSIDTHLLQNIKNRLQIGKVSKIIVEDSKVSFTTGIYTGCIYITGNQIVEAPVKKYFKC